MPTIKSVTLEEEVFFKDDNKTMNKWLLDVDEDGTTVTGVEMWLLTSKDPPSEGQNVTLDRKGGKIKARFVKGGGGGGRRGGGGDGYGYKTPPEDAQRMSRSTGLTAAATVANAVGLDSSQKVLGLAQQFADFIFNGPKQEEQG